MIRDATVTLRPVGPDDWSTIEEWAAAGELWGPHQRLEPGDVRAIREAWDHTGLVGSSSGLLLIEPAAGPAVVGFVRYAPCAIPDAELTHPEIGFGIPDPQHRGRGYATAATALLVGHLLDGSPVERISAVTDVENAPARAVLEHVGFEREGVIRRSYFHHGAWHDVALYGYLRRS